MNAYYHSLLNLKNFKASKFLLLMSLVIILLIVDTSILKLSNFISNELNSVWSVGSFAILAFSLGSFQYLILRHVASRAPETRILKTSKPEWTLHRALIVAQFTMLG